MIELLMSVSGLELVSCDEPSIYLAIMNPRGGRATGSNRGFLDPIRDAEIADWAEAKLRKGK